MNLPNWKKYFIPVISILIALGFTILSCSAISEARGAQSNTEPVPFTEAVEPEIKKPQIAKQEINKSSEMVEVVLEEITEEPDWNLINISPEPEEEIPTLDRTKPLYNVYKDGFEVEVSTELQWYIRDMCEEYSFYEKYVYGMILAESTFQPAVSNGGCIGLCQINKFWIRGAAITHFTDDYRDRDLKDPYDNLLTMTEMWCYARDTYGLDLMTEDGIMRVLYWHNSGSDPRYISRSNYADVCMKYANELVPLQ